MPAHTTTDSTDFIRNLFEALYEAGDGETLLEDTDLPTITAVDEAEANGWIGVDGVEVRTSDGRRFLVTAQEVSA